ncbi:hypothetical protein ABK046_46500, partial [Streptomyces caeruleatus]
FKKEKVPSEFAVVVKIRMPFSLSNETETLDPIIGFDKLFKITPLIEPVRPVNTKSVVVIVLDCTRAPDVFVSNPSKLTVTAYEPGAKLLT